MAGELNGILKYVRRRAGSGAEIDGIGRWYGGKPVFFAMCVIPTGRVKEMCVQWKKKVRERVEGSHVKIVRLAPLGEERVPVVTLSAAIKAGYALSLLGSAGLSAKLTERGWDCAYSGFKLVMGMGRGLWVSPQLPDGLYIIPVLGI